MVICKFFLQGNCKFGERCRYEHTGQQYGYQDQSGYYGGGGGQQGGQQWSYGRGGRGGGQNYYQGGKGEGGDHNYQGNQKKVNFRNSFGQNQNPYTVINKPNGSNVQTIKDMSPHEIVQAISQEMDVWEKSKMWPLSCFAYGKDVPCIPGLDDMSTEEVRWKAYESQKSGAFDGYKQWMQALCHNQNTKRSSLKQPDAQTRHKLGEWIKNVNQAGSSSQTSSGQSLFGASSGSSSVSSGPFGGSSAGFGSSVATAPSQNQSAFGAAPGTQGISVFNRTNQAASSSFLSPASAFAAPASTANVFGETSGSTSQTFTTAPSSGGQGFGGAAPSGGTVFGGGAASSTSQGFGFGPSPTPGLFGGAAPSGGAQTAFGNASLPFTPQHSTGSIGFGSTPAPNVTNTLYTPIDQLTAEERAQFEAPKFVLGKIPTRPPPKELV